MKNLLLLQFTKLFLKFNNLDSFIYKGEAAHKQVRIETPWKLNAIINDVALLIAPTYQKAWSSNVLEYFKKKLINY